MENEQRVYGIVYEPHESESGTHSHEIFLVTWDGRMLHTHGFSGVTSFDVGHRHNYAGITQPAPSGVPHTHAYSTVTSFNDGHEHYISGRTGPAIPIPGGHYHVFEGVTTINGRTPHRHVYTWPHWKRAVSLNQISRGATAGAQGFALGKSQRTRWALGHPKAFLVNQRFCHPNGPEIRLHVLMQ